MLRLSIGPPWGVSSIDVNESWAESRRRELVLLYGTCTLQ